MSKNTGKTKKSIKIITGLIIIVLIIGAFLGLSSFRKSSTQTGSGVGNSLASKPSEIFDADGTNPDGLHIGDFVNYDAGTWTQEEINAIQTGLKTNLVTANGSTSFPNRAFQFGGFTAGSSRNGNATPRNSTYNYVKDASTGSAITGWRVFDIEGDTVTLISAGNPEDYYHLYGDGYGSEYILTGNINSSWRDGATQAENYQRRDWSNYINTAQKGESATVLTESRLDEWYTRYTDTPNANVYTDATFQKIYTDPAYHKYQNMVDNYSYYWLFDAFDSYSLCCVNPSTRRVSRYSDYGIAYGVRVLVSLSSEVQLEKAGTKTVTGGWTTRYGGDQTYNTWDIVTDTTPPNPGTISASAAYTNQSTVTVYVNAPSDAESGISHVEINGWYGDDWNGYHQSKTGTYDSANNRYYATFTFSEMPNTTTGATNQGEGTYSIDAHVYDNAGNEATPGVVRVVYDTTAPTYTSYEIKNVTKDGYDVYVYGVSDATSGVNRVVFPTWTETNGQDDMVTPWQTSEVGKDLGGGTWYYRVNASDHNNESDYYNTHIYIYDNAGNVSNVIPTQTYIDTQLPTSGNIFANATEIESDTEEYTTYATNQEQITVYVAGASDDESGIAKVYIGGWTGGSWVEHTKIISATYDSTDDIYYATFNLSELPDTTTGETNKGETTYVFDAYVEDNFGNGVFTPTWIEVIYDTTSPTLSVDTDSCTWRNTVLNVTITAEDPTSNESTSGLSASNEYEYYLSNSATELSGGEWTSYANGMPISIDPKITGTYYLFVKNVSDNAGNTTAGTAETASQSIAETAGTSETATTRNSGTENYQLMGTYQFDYDKPTLGTLTMKTGSLDGDDYISNTITTQNVFVYANEGRDALSGHASTTYSVNGGEAKGAGPENATELTEQGIYYITVTTTDIAGNTITSSDYIVNINSAEIEPTIDMENGTIDPIYKPEWTKVESSIDVDAQTLTVVIKGSAYKSEIIDENVEINYASDIASTLTAEDITVFIDGVEVTSTTNPIVTVNAGTIEVSEESGKTEVTHTLQLSNLREAVRQAGIPYREWSGNISLKIAGRGQDASTYTADVLTDEYGNQNMMETDQNGTNDDGTWIDIKIEDEEIDKNTDGIMFADFIKPEFTYKYSEADIDYTGKTVKVVFTVTDKYFSESTLTIDDLTILVDGEEPDWATAEEAATEGNTKPVKEFSSVNDVTATVNGVEKVIGKEYTVLLSKLEQDPNDGFNYSGFVTVEIPAEKITDTSGNTNNAQTITMGVEVTENGDVTTDDPVIADVVDPIISVTDEGLSVRNEENSINLDEKTVTVIVQAEDKYLAEGNLLTEEFKNNIKVQIEENDGDIIEDASATELKLIKADGTVVEDQTELNKLYNTTRIVKTITEIETTDTSITYQIVLSNFGRFEGKVTLVIPENSALDSSGNGNIETPVLVGNTTYTTPFKDSIVDFVKPSWKYVSTDTTKLESEGKISFTIKGVDTRLDITNSNLEIADIKVVKNGETYIDGANSADSANITINYIGADESEKSKTYTIEISGVSETGTYSLVIAKDTLVDEIGNTSAGTTITFSNAEIPENTERYGSVTYHVTPNTETEHESYVHELITGDTTTYRPSTLGELFNNGENPLFAEPMNQSFAGWAEADENGNIIEGGAVYGLYDEIPKTVTHLKAVWQDATVIFVSASAGNNSNEGTTPTTPVQDLETAYNKLNADGNSSNNIIVIMDAVEFNNTSTLTGNATITSLYAGVDYKAQGAELKIASNMTISGDITFDNIELYTDDINNKLVVNSETQVILGRGITTPSDKYTFGAISGGNLEPETIIVEAGIYNNIVAGSISASGTTAGTTHKVVIGNKRDALVGNNEKLTITSENTAIYLRALNGVTEGTVDFEMYSGKVNGNIYGGSSTSGENITNNLTFYGGEIAGNIYGGGINGTSGNVGTTNIVMENKTYSQITFGGSIYGAGINETSSNSSIHLENFGTAPGAGTVEPYVITSIEMADNLYIGNSCIELTGASNTTNIDTQTSYTLNKIGELTIYDNTTLYTQRGFNKVEEFNSYETLTADGTGTLATIANSDNRLYTLEGVNLIFATEEGDLSNRNSEDIWGDVNGMTMFGMYTENEAGEKLYDESLFAVGTYVEGREKTNHDITVDGFYTSAKEVIGITDNGTNYDWILGENVINYEIQLIASASGKDGVAEVVLDYSYLPEATYTLADVSTNALINANDIDINLVDPLTIPVASENANNTFGLTVETSESGWYSQGIANIYKDSFAGDTLFESDNSDTPGAIRFKIHNSSNITEENDLGFINVVLNGTKASGADTEGETFKVAISINLQTVVEEQPEEGEQEPELQYTPTFTGREEKELNYTADSKVEITYTLHVEIEQTPYASGDYRVLTTTTRLPAGTRITMKDLAQGKVYYYHVTGSETEYRLSNFLEMDSTNSYYTDTDSYYNGTYVLEKYEISIDFLDANIVANQLAQEIYLELRSSDGTVKYNNGDTTINYNLYYNQNAVMQETISNEGQTYEVLGDIEIPFTLDVSLLEQEVADGNKIMDTKYYDKIEGIAIEILDENGNRLQGAQNFTIVNQDNLTEIYEADSNGVIRIPVMEGLSSITKNYKMTINQNSAETGTYTVKVYFFASDDGKYIGNEENVQKEFYLTFDNKESGLIAIEATDESRIISQATGLNLEGNSGIDMNITVGGPTSQTNVRVELYKRDQTYTDPYDETTYTGTQYTLVDIKDYLEGTWQTPEEADNELVSETDSKQYILLPRQDYEASEELITIDLARALKADVGSGEYKVVIKLYEDNTLVETVRKTFIVVK